MCLIGFGFVLCGLPGYWRIQGSTAWPTVNAVVQSNEIATRLHRGRPYFIPRIRYSYRVQGSKFSGSALSLAKREPSFHEKKDAEKVLLGHPVGSELKVHYHPSAPWESVVEPGLSDEQQVLLWMGYVLLVFFGAAALALSKVLRKTPPNLDASGKPTR